MASSGECGYDIIVVGAGIVGSSAAYQAQKAGHKTLLVEQVIDSTHVMLNKKFSTWAEDVAQKRGGKNVM